MDAAGERPAVEPRLVFGVAILAVSTGALFVRLADAPSLAVAFWRCALATAVLAALFLPRCLREWRRLARADAWLLGAAGLALSVHFATWISSLAYTSVASSIVIVNTTPLWVALLAPRLAGERVSRATLAAMALSVAGCVVIGAGDFELSARALLGDALALVGAWMAALYLLAGRRVRRLLTLAPYVTGCYGVAAAFLLLFTLVARVPLTGYGAATWGWLACLALVPQLIGHSSYNWALRYVSTTLTAVATLGESVGAVALAWLFLREVPSLQTLAGGAIVMSGLWLAMRAERA